jgi:hypothetical protein
MAWEEQARDQGQRDNWQEKKRHNDRQRVMPPAQGPSLPIRRHAEGGQVDHQAVNEYSETELQWVPCPEIGFHERASQTKQEEDGKRAEIVAGKDHDPSDKERHEHDHAMQSHHIQVVRRSRDVT